MYYVKNFVVQSEPWSGVNSAKPWAYYLTQIPAGGQNIQ